jgi:hypothetical protein
MQQNERSVYSSGGVPSGIGNSNKPAVGGPAKQQAPLSHITALSNKRRLEAERAAIKTREQLSLARQQEQLQRQREINEKSAIWLEQILPKWSSLQHSPRVKELCSRGIPPNVRGKVWPRLVGNDLEVRT